MKYKNPIISGFHPDPSICRVEDDFYLVNSTFEYFPGIPVYHSKDLLHWKQIGHCITRNSQLTLRKGVPNMTGIYAPTIRYQNGIYYVVTTNVTYGAEQDGNFFVWTKDPYGEWSDPVWINCPGIDPSFYFEEEGFAYYTGAHNNHIFLAKIDLTTGKVVEEGKEIWAGTGGNDPEGPHIYKINGWYYLFISEGGTEYGHMLTVARSKTIDGPYESCPHNPVLTNRSRSLPIKAVGHADIVQDQNGNWWTVCLGVRPIAYPFKYNLGRETMLVPFVWDQEGWPVMGNNGLLEEEIETHCLPLTSTEVIVNNIENKRIFDDFQKENLSLCWNFIYNPVEGLWELTKEGLVLSGNEISLSQADSLAWLGRRQEHLSCRVRTKLSFAREEDEDEAGLTIYMNNQHHYEIALTKLEGKGCLIFRRQIGSLWKVEQRVPYDADEVEFELQASPEHYIFRYGENGEYKTIGQGEASYLTTEVGGRFTGNYVAIYATGNGKKCRQKAKFQWFEYIIEE